MKFMAKEIICLVHQSLITQRIFLAGREATVFLISCS